MPLLNGNEIVSSASAINDYFGGGGAEVRGKEKKIIKFYSQSSVLK